MSYMIFFLVLLAVVVSKLRKWYERRRAARTGRIKVVGSSRAPNFDSTHVVTVHLHQHTVTRPIGPNCRRRRNPVHSCRD